MMSGEEWVRGLNRLISRSDLPVTLQGGEPTLHPDFIAIVNGIKPELRIDLLTNLEVDLGHFMTKIEPSRIRRDAPYASIRVSYHPEVMDIESLAMRVVSLQDAGYHVGIWGVLHPCHNEEIMRAQDYCTALGIDFRIKEFLGEHNGSMYGNLYFPDACDQQTHQPVECRTTELLIGPGGDVYRCHADLYQDRHAVGHILDPHFFINDTFRICDNYGSCNPCDVKHKTNRFQEYGHTSVEIRSTKLNRSRNHDGNSNTQNVCHSGSGTGT
jgi:MoaA/NifB/PqqE/SkfB family radical SAM enzyme